jgi:hypothetical protein
MVKHSCGWALPGDTCRRPKGKLKWLLRQRRYQKSKLAVVFTNAAAKHQVEKYTTRIGFFDIPTIIFQVSYVCLLRTILFQKSCKYEGTHDLMNNMELKHNNVYDRTNKKIHWNDLESCRHPMGNIFIFTSKISNHTLTSFAKKNHTLTSTNILLLNMYPLGFRTIP